MNEGLSAADVMALCNNKDNDMWSNPFIYFVWMALFSGNGFGFGNRDAGIQGALTRADISDGFTMNNIERQIQDLSRGLCTTDAHIAENRFSAEKCCCDVKQEIMQNRYDAAVGLGNIANSMNLNTRDIIESQTRGFQTILDKMCDQEIQKLRTDLQSAQLALSNSVQTTNIINAVRPFPQPAYITTRPYQSATLGNCGCGI